MELGFIITMIRLIAISSSILTAINDYYPLNLLVYGQIGTPCTTSMLTTFTPCFNFITGSSNNGSTPTTGCCDSLRSLMSTSMNCACLVITANVPIQLPINQALALSLPQACNIGGIPVQCKASGTPLPAPGPALLGPIGPTLPPSSSIASKTVLAEVAAPESEPISQMTPAPLTPTESEAPTAAETIPKPTRIRPVLTPPTSNSPYICSSPLLIVLIIASLALFLNS